MILDKKLVGILSQEDRALQIFEPSESDKVYEVFLKDQSLWINCPGLAGDDWRAGRRRRVSLQESWKIEVKIAIRRKLKSRPPSLSIKDKKTHLNSTLRLYCNI